MVLVVDLQSLPHIRRVVYHQTLLLGFLVPTMVVLFHHVLHLVREVRFLVQMEVVHWGFRFLALVVRCHGFLQVADS